MKPVGSVDIRPPLEQELTCLDPKLHEKVTIAEWRPLLDIPNSPTVKLLVINALEGRQFHLLGSLNGWSSLCQAVEAVTQLGLMVAEAYGLMPRAELDRACVGLFRNIQLLPHMSEFRKRAYRTVRDYRPSAEGVRLSLMPEYFIEPPQTMIVGRGEEERFDESTLRKKQLREVTEEVFGPKSTAGLLTQLALYAATHWRCRDPLGQEQAWRAVVGAIAVGDFSREEVEQAVRGRTAEALAARIDKVAGKEDDVMDKVFRGYQKRGFADLARSLGLPRKQVRRDVLCIMVDSFWDLPAPWNVVMASIRALIRPTLDTMEATMYDRLYLPQDYLAGLPPCVLWARCDIVMSISLQLLATPPNESWRLNAIPHCLEVYREMDNFTRSHDRNRKAREKLYKQGGVEVGNSKGNSPREEPTATVPDTPLDMEEVKSLLDREITSGAVPCSKCGEYIKGYEIVEAGGAAQATVRLQPCGCSFGDKN